VFKFISTGDPVWADPITLSHQGRCALGRAHIGKTDETRPAKTSQFPQAPW